MLSCCQEISFPYCFYCPENAVLLHENEKMKDMEKEMKLFYELLENGRIFMDRSVGFGAVCLWMGVDRNEMDACLMRELGYTGDEILTAYRVSQYDTLIHKYGLSIDY